MARDSETTFGSRVTAGGRIRRRATGRVFAGLIAAASVSLVAAVVVPGEAAAVNPKAPFYNLLPANVKKAGFITDASSFDYPPYAFTTKTGKYVGSTITILNHISPLLGVPFHWVKYTDFDSVVPSVADGRAEMATEGIGITTARRKVVSYVSIGWTGEGLLVHSGNPSGISVKDICGHSVAVEAGAVEVTFYKTISNKCVAAGKPKVTVAVYATEPGQVLAVEDGHANAAGVGTVSVKTIASKSGGKLVGLMGNVPGGTLEFGFLFNPTESVLAEAVYKAILDLQKNGTLTKIQKKWTAETRFQIAIVKST